MNYESSTAVPVSDKAPVFSGIRFAAIHGKNAKIGMALRGLAESPLTVSLRDVSLSAEKPDVLEYARLVTD